MKKVTQIEDLPLYRPEAREFPWDALPERFSAPALTLGRQLRTDPVQFFVVEAALAGFILAPSVPAHSMLTDTQPTLLNFILVEARQHCGRNVLNLPVRALYQYLDDARIAGGGCDPREARERERALIAESKGAAPGERLEIARRIARLRVSTGPEWICATPSPREIVRHLSRSYGQRLLLNGLGGRFIGRLLTTNVALSERMVRELLRAWTTGGCALSGQGGDSVAGLWSAPSQDVADWLAQVRRRMGGFPDAFILHCAESEYAPTGPDDDINGWDSERATWNAFLAAMVDSVVMRRDKPATPLSSQALEIMHEFYLEVSASQGVLPDEVGSIHTFVHTAERLATIFHETTVGGEEISASTAATAVAIARYLEWH